MTGWEYFRGKRGARLNERGATDGCDARDCQEELEMMVMAMTMIRRSKECGPETVTPAILA